MELVLLNSTSYPYCQKEEDVWTTFKYFEALVDTYAGNSNAFGCPLPCTYSYFKTLLREYHRSSWVVPEPILEDHFKLAVSLAHPFTEVTTETNLYDLGNSLGQLGGNLGLLLGFSCLSIYFFTAEWIQKMIISNY